jgi:transcription antitermination factor NusG
MAQQQTFINQLHGENSRWFAIYAGFKKEKIAKNLLEKKGIETYFPTQKVVRKYERKVKKLEIPLINCYLFVRIIKSEYVHVLETEHVSRFIKIGKDLIAIPDTEIDILQRVLGENIELAIEQNRFYEGDEVVVSQGSLAGLTGKLVSFQGKEKVMVELVTIGYSMLIEMDKSLLTKAV